MDIIHQNIKQLLQSEDHATQELGIITALGSGMTVDELVNYCIDDEWLQWYGMIHNWKRIFINGWEIVTYTSVIKVWKQRNKIQNVISYSDDKEIIPIIKQELKKIINEITT